MMETREQIVEYLIDHKEDVLQLLSLAAGYGHNMVGLI
jgi:hypothetical protein